MKRNLNIFLITLFFAAQVLSLLHMAEHGFEEHEHDGQTCEVYLHSEQTKNADKAKPVILQTMMFTEIGPPIISPVLISKDTFNGVSTRGPPTFLLS